MQKDFLIVHSDGGSRGNPGPAASSFVIELNSKVIKEDSFFLGVATNNVAEYKAVFQAVKWLAEKHKNFKFKGIFFYLDSELIVRQLNGDYKTKKEDLKILNIGIKNLLTQINKEFRFIHVPRGQNKRADKLVNEELDRN